MKKWFGFLLVLVVLAGCVFLLMPETKAATQGDYTYTVSEGEATITKCNTSISGEVSIPAALGGYPVTKIDKAAFANCKNITQITIPAGVTEIGYEAFFGCSAMEHVFFEAGTKLTVISEYAFGRCTGLIEITIPASVTRMGTQAFSNCTGLQAVFFESNSQLTTIAGGTFISCEKLEEITIPAKVKEIGASAFYGCKALQYLSFAENAQLTVINDKAFYGCSSIIALRIPANVETIGKSAFYNCASLAALTFAADSKLTVIGDHAFYDCDKLADLSIPDSVTTIQSNAFGHCERMTAITFGENSQLTTLADHAFFSSGLDRIVIPKGVTVISDNLFSYCDNLSSVTMHDGITEIGSMAFYFSSIYYLEIPSSVTKIGSSVFWGSRIGYNTYEKGNYLGNSENPYLVFMGSQSQTITSFTIHPNTKLIYSGAFSECSSLTELAIPEGVLQIGSSTFYNCVSLTKVNIPAGVTAIENSTFNGCSSLGSIRLPEKLTRIGNYAFQGCRKLTEIRIPETVTSIGSYAFKKCASLTAITIPKGVGYCGHELLAGCSSLTEITFPTSALEEYYVLLGVEECTLYPFGYFFGSKSYAGSYGVEQRYIDSYVDEEGPTPTIVSPMVNETFYIPNGLKKVTVSEGRAYDDIFRNCKGIDITISESVTEFGWGAFYNCTGLTEISIPEGQTQIRGCTFYGCTGLKTIYIPKSVTHIENGAFGTCFGVTTAYYAGSKAEWEKISIGSGNEGLTNATLHTVEPVTTELSIESLPKKTVYYQGEALDTTGLVLKAVMASGETVTLTEGYTVFGYDSSEIGVQTITVTYGEMTVTFTVEVKALYITRVEIEQLPQKLEFWLHEQPDTTGLRLAVIWSNGTVETVTEGYAVSMDFGPVGKQPVTVTYKEQSTTYEVEVKKGGSCGENLTWFLDENGTLTVTGTGAMTDFANSDSVVWRYIRDEVKKVIIEKGVTTIGSYAFSYCGNLSEITIPTGVTVIGGYAFERTHALQEVSLPTSLKTMGSYLFYRSEGIQSIVIPNSVTVLGASAFSRCVNLRQVTIGTGVTKLERYTFYTCTNLTIVTVPDSVTVMGDQVFENCSGLTTVTLSRNLTSIGKKSFSGCTALQSVYYRNTAAKWAQLTIGETNELLLEARLYTCEEMILAITGQPENVQAQVGETVTFTVMAEGDGLSYKWQYKNAAATSWSNTSLAGYNTDTLTVANVNGANHNGRQYRCIITDAGGNTVTSESATLSVAYLVKDAKSRNAQIGENAVFSVEYSITEGVTYRWEYKGNTTSSTWANTSASGNKTNTLTVQGKATNNRYMYRCKINVPGVGEFYSKEVYLNIVEEAAQIIASPVDASVVCGDYATFTVSAIGNGLSYQWQFCNPAVGVWSNTKSTGYSTATLTVKTNNFNNGYQYRCVVKTLNGSAYNRVYSEAATLTVLPAVEIHEPLPQTITAKVGETISLHIGTDDVGITYQWQWAKFKGNWKNTTLPGATTDTLIVTPTRDYNGRYYRVIIKNQYGGTLETSAVQLIVE